MPKPKSAKSKSSRNGDGQMELSDRPARKRAAATDSAAVAESSRQLRPHWWNRVVGISLAPFVWIFSAALFYILRHALTKADPVAGPFWKSHDFLVFSIGAVLWLACFCISLKIWREPLGQRAYVLGHELMHALMALASLGKIKGFHISRDGGYVVTNKYNFLIALGPYLLPFYSVPVLIAWGVSSWWPEASPHRDWFLGALGYTWMFHLTFTLWIMPRGQTDFHGPGHIFSFLLIYTANTFFLSATLIMLAPNVTWHDYGVALWESAMGFYDKTAHAAVWLVHWFGGIVRALAG